MKKIFTILTAMLITATVWAQSPEKMSYQSVIRDASNQLIINQDMGMQISILQGSAGGTEIYVETHSTSSNTNGLVTIEIGTGATSDDFSAIEWTNGPYFLKTETDPTTSGGTNYTITGTSQLLSVPYALHANTTDSLVGGVSIKETDPVFAASVAADITGTDTIYWNSKEFLVDTDEDTKIQVEESDDEDLIRFDLGGIERWVMTGTRLEPKNTGQSVFLGDSTGAFDDLSDNNNVFIGFKPGFSNTSGSYNIFFGYKAGYLNQTGGNNVFIGTESGFESQFTSQNTFIGYRSGYEMTGSGNTAMGSMAGENAGGGNNTFVGTSAGRIATGGNNTFLGNGAGYSFPNENTGVRNTFIGQAVGSFTNTGSYNVMLGFNAGYLNYEGSRNTFLGYDAGHNIHEGSGNIFIGHNAGYYADGINNRLILDNENVDSTDVLLYGEFDQNHLRINGNVGINYQAYNSYGLIVDIPDGQTSIYTLLIYGDAWASGGSWNSSDLRYKKNVKPVNNALVKLQKLRAVTFDFKNDEYPEKKFPDRNQFGFIAQEVEEIFPELVKEDHEGYKAINYNKFTPIIVEAVNEQQQEIENLKQKIKELEDKLQVIINKSD